MLSCAALTFLGAAALTDISMLSNEVETSARALTVQTEITPGLLADLADFSGDAERLSAALNQVGVEQDLPCIFHDIATDARVRMSEFRDADTEAERAAAFTNLRVLMDDAIQLAPIAASMAADEVARAGD
ncbi:hypothetical protein [Vitreimonas sp.]|mgnify:CR=1 FL=1|jgi:hypothetical protein|uniref:hypothetical protein n=1 Tax=Vitreimonas sp. TaxID=3069702 RepID=UPI002ED9103E